MDSKEKWYALYTRPRHEKKAYDLLIEKGKNAYIPLLKTVRVWKNRKKTVELPLFPSYIFCRFEYKNRFDILETHGVIKIVNFKGQPAVVPDWQIESLKTILLNPETLQMENYFRQGDLVEVKSGPFSGLKGSIVSQKGQSRFVITIDGIMQSISVEIDAHHLENLQE
jgi:transcription elongation factor/antiterminator RfaH